MRASLAYLLADGFDPDTGELSLRVGLNPGGAEDPDVLRLRLYLGRTGDPLMPLRRELSTHLQTVLPPSWDHGLKVIIHAVEEDLGKPEGREPSRYTWVQTQIFHPSDPRWTTLGHPVPRQVEILWDWAHRLDQQGYRIRCMELLERLLLLAPQHSLALETLTEHLRTEALVEESLPFLDRLIALRPEAVEPRLRKGEALLALDRPKEALELFTALIASHGLHALVHLGAAQARAHLGGDPCPHLDAALELNREGTLSVLRETFDHRILVELPGETLYPLEELPALLGITLSELRAFIEKYRLPFHEQGVREKELSLWVTLQNRYQLLPFAVHWLAPTPRALPGF